jgi:hypothetical protein
MVVPMDFGQINGWSRTVGYLRRRTCLPEDNVKHGDAEIEIGMNR